MFLPQSIILYLCKFLLILWKFLLLMKSFAWWGLTFQFVVVVFSQAFCGVFFLSNCLLILWKFLSLMKPFIAWWGCPVACDFCFVSQAFLEEVWKKTQIENVSIFIIYLMCKQLYWKLFVSDSPFNKINLKEIL